MSNGKESLVFGLIIGCLTYAFMWWQGIQVSSVIEKMNPMFEITIEKEISSWKIEDGYKKGKDGYMVTAYEDIRCVRATLESKVSGQKHVEYFLINVTKQSADAVSESDAKYCLNKK